MSERIVRVFHTITDLERIGDHAENFHEIGVELLGKGLSFSDKAKGEFKEMHDKVMSMFDCSKKAFETLDHSQLAPLTALENEVDGMKKTLTASHFARLAGGDCDFALSPYYSSVVSGLERVADHIINVGYSIQNPTGSQKENA